MDKISTSKPTYRLTAPRESDQSQLLIPIPTGSENSKKKRTSMACVECKIRRTKCTGGFPCSECAAHENECIYDQNADKRRKEYTQATEIQLQVARSQVRFYHTLFEDLLESIRSSDRTQMQQLTSAIRQTRENADTTTHNEYGIVRNRIDEILGFCEDAEGSDVTLFLEGDVECHL